MEEKYDIIVAGAGMSGALAASAAAKKGANVILLDRNDFTEAGKKTNWGWVCGDAVAKSHTDFITERIGLRFDEPEIDLKVDGVYALSPDLQHKFIFDGEGYTLDRPKFAKKLVEYAKKHGVEYVTKFEVEGPIIEEGKIVGIFGRDENHKQTHIRADIVIDALGVASTLRRKLPENNYIGRTVSTDDIESTGRYIMKVELEGNDLKYYDPKNALIHLNQEMAPGGYGWVFPKKSGRINIGLGVEKKSLEIRNEKTGKKDTLHSLIDEYVKWNPLIKSWDLDPTDNNGKGYWSVTVRRQQDSLVYPGYMGAGDSMAMPNPISAGGIGPAMVAGYLAGESAAQAIEEGDTSIESLWRYNLKYNEEYGNKTAGLEVFRIYLQSMNNDLINYGMRNFITEQEAIDMSYGRVPELTIASTFQKMLSGIQNIDAFRNLMLVSKKMKTLNALYAKYPKSPKEFKPWRDAVVAEIREAKEKFKPNPI